jgi:hypothetical protein
MRGQYPEITAALNKFAIHHPKATASAITKAVAAKRPEWKNLITQYMANSARAAGKRHLEPSRSASNGHSDGNGHSNGNGLTKTKAKAKTSAKATAPVDLEYVLELAQLRRSFGAEQFAQANEALEQLTAIL